MDKPFKPVSGYLALIGVIVFVVAAVVLFISGKTVPFILSGSLVAF